MKFRKYPNFTPPPPATDDEILACEKRNNIALPPGLISLLKIQNGGDLDNGDIGDNSFESLSAVTSNSDPGSPWWQPQIASLHDWLLARGDLHDNEDSYHELDHLGNLKRLISIGGTGTLHYLLDYRANSVEPKVYRFDLVLGDQELHLVSDNFETLLTRLK